MLHRTLGARVALFAGLLVALGLTALSVTLIHAHRSQVIEEVIHVSDKVAQMIRLSINHDMLGDTPEGVRRVIQAVGSHPGVERIRLYNKEGEISYSSQPDESGNMVDKKAEACIQCHDANEPLRHLSISDRSRIYEDATGKKILATISVIPNEQQCAQSDCHESTSEKSVLGVLDVSVSMEPTERRLQAAAQKAVLLSLGTLVLTSFGLFFVIRLTVNRPVWSLINATRQVASGDFNQKVSPTAAAEIGILARSFNQMIENIHTSRTEQDEWISSLQDELGEKSREVRAAQFQAMQAEKLSAVGLVAAGVAHELNSPLMAIITFAHLVQRNLAADSQEHHDLQMILAEANRCALIIRNLLDFSREEKMGPHFQSCDPAEILEHAMQLVRPEFRKCDIEEEFLVAKDLPTIKADPAQLTQVFLNLMLNAVQAMESGGKLSVKVDEVEREAVQDHAPPLDVDGPLVRFRFRDSGHGIPQTEIARVFEPFYTTKPAGQGSGLGLSVSHGIVTRHGGTIIIDSDSQTWTEFTLFLPAGSEDDVGTED